MPAHQSPHVGTRRAPAWGADLPADDAEARDRLLDAAEQCYAEIGPSRTKMSHIAARAGVHRTTVYNYFSSRDEVLAASYIRAAGIVLDSAQPYWDSDKPFLDKLIDACVVGIEVARGLPPMQVLINRNELPHTQAIAAASEDWQTRIREAIGHRLAGAAAAGQIRSDLTPDALAQWIVRICISLTMDPPDPHAGGDEAVLQAFLPRCLAP
ncbi:TetR/AcrR family transcriptional regulator [[Mycobacterium] fortunisiensis]|uniref:TetR/AcrR family transcriptional regulator n=1 Tax=[Mycobacterium] fortunisiensis TaxID=2600579 RepID=UPI0027E14CE6|nr:TetR/AcrR family transcriptional regulator [[Mycobacterium] fortunisiensis]